MGKLGQFNADPIIVSGGPVPVVRLGCIVNFQVRMSLRELSCGESFMLNVGRPSNRSLRMFYIGTVRNSRNNFHYPSHARS
jgi:hypothetical protein